MECQPHASLTLPLYYNGILPVSGIYPSCGLRLVVDEIGLSIKVYTHIPTFREGAVFRSRV
jgi:hypothetical protein